jgi:hypothetical protein
MQDEIYFANEPRETIAPRLMDMVSRFYDEVERNGRLALWRRSHRYYFALDEQGFHEASTIRSTGSNGQLSLLKANHYRNLLRHLYTLTTQQRTVFDCRANNTDYKSQVQTILGRNILEYYLREQHLDAVLRQAADVAIPYGEAYVEVEWDAERGEDAAGDLDTEELLKTGDVTTRVYEPINVPRPCRADGDSRSDWYILRRRHNKYDLAAKHPEQAQAILRCSDESSDKNTEYVGYQVPSDDDSDLVWLYTLYHGRTPACPLGRQVKFLNADIVLEYDRLQYAELPVFAMIPARQHGTTFGYTVAFDLLCVQEAIDQLYSIIHSNQATFGVQNIWMRPGSNISTTQLAGALNVIESAEKPEPINLTHTPPEIFNFLQGLETLGEVLSGVNSVARGQPEASLKSGNALALVASQAVQFSNDLQAAYIKLTEDVGTAVLRTLQTRATLPRTAVIAGKDNKSYAKEFVRNDIKDISRVVVDAGNPVSRTIAGRMQMADNLLQARLIQRPEQYIQVMETGTIEPMVDEERAEILLINAENEALREGRPVVVIAVDRHAQHIKNHRAVLADPEARQDPSVVNPTLVHIQEHLDALRTLDPAMLSMLGENAIMPAQPGMPPPGPQGENAPQPNSPPPDGGAPAGAPPPGAPVPAPQGTPPDVAANMPKMPQVPPGTPPTAA